MLVKNIPVALDPDPGIRISKNRIRIRNPGNTTMHKSKCGRQMESAKAFVEDSRAKHDTYISKCRFDYRRNARTNRKISK